MTRGPTETGAPAGRPRARHPALPALLLLLAACGCPPEAARWDTPLATLTTWQARLCRDDVEGEYACLARSFQAALNGFETYYVARRALLDREPAAAWLFRRADLAEHVRSTSFHPDGRHAALVLQAGKEQLQVTFEREAFVTVTWDDGRSETARQRAAPAELLVEDPRDRRTWLAIERPDITDPARVSAIRLDVRWQIADLAGLARPAEQPLETVP